MTENADSKVQVQTYHIQVGNVPASARIDAYLSARFPDYSRTFIQKLIKNGGVVVNGHPVKPSYAPAKDDRITARVPTLDSDSIEPEQIDLDIIYEDDWILVINKPCDMVVHPARGHQSGTLVNAAAYHCQNLSTCSGGNRPGIVHRLDKDTTGVIVMVKDNSVHEAIAKQFEQRTIKKEYLAVCEGTVELDSDLIDAPIGKHNRSKEKMAIRYDRGKSARTIYKVQERIGGVSVVRCFPISGRTHQIRLHLRHIGHPIVCDPLYGHGDAVFRSDITAEEHQPGEQPIIERHALHAARITLHHPALGETISFHAPEPQDIISLIEVMRQAAPRRQAEAGV